MRTPPYSPHRTVDGLTVFSGLIGVRGGERVDGLEHQLTEIFAQLDARLAEVGLHRRHVFKTTVFLTDLGRWADLNVPYLEYFGGGQLPARTVVGCSLAFGLEVELEAWAHVRA